MSGYSSIGRLASPVTWGRFGVAMARGSWAGALWLGRRFGGPVGEPIMPAGTAALDRLSWSARRRLDPLSQLLLLLGEDLDRTARDYLPAELNAEAFRRAAQSLQRDAMAGLSCFGAGRAGRAARLELAHKAEVYLLVRRAGAALGADGHCRERFLAVAQAALDLDPRHVLWALEGMGHAHTEAVLRRYAKAEGSQRQGERRDQFPSLLQGLDLPDSALLMAHLGMGMAIAEHVLHGLFPGDPEAAQRAVDHFQRLCRANANPPQLDAALESFGLVARCFFPELVPGLHQALAGNSQDPGSRLPGHYFWHGVGRALYFLPLHLLPGYGHAPAALRRADTEAADEESRRYARSGVAYACTLVNLGSPEVLEILLDEYLEQVDESFVEGLVSALMLRQSITPDDQDLKTFLNHRPIDPKTGRRWRQKVSEPLDRALAAAEASGSVVQKVRELTGGPR